ncbi:MAG: glycine cleavage system protein GcvH [Gammaproteobacteria bacterium]
MSDIFPSELKYTASHEWVRAENDGTYVVGITQHAQELLGEMVYVELPEINAEFKQAQECAVVESVKAASDVYSPLSGVVIAVNNELEQTPELVNQHPYQQGWLFKLKPTNLDAEVATLLNANAYQQQVAQESE